ncbi:probable BOI-related E3 ubiquitin-protein ligase 3 [Impatiens glandulifera]|uniref:probable BOI-related E3 ubiquitin-protein ligase 3 n=1 Tax=Impatiens glandulifera TaxID=253017 RepID=UPI001FB0C56E|nr:probable BOI-related E3 ubiquitin-protein ligase 3 [Impatiens glandulifera]
MIGLNVQGNRTDFNNGYIHQQSGITTSTPFPIFTPSNAAPTITDNSGSRKRSRDLVTDPSPSYNHSSSFVFSQIEQQHQLEIDQLVYQHAEKMKYEITERRNRDVRGIINAIEQGIMKKLKLKDDEISNIINHNSTLEDKVKSLCIENQLWRDLAQNNEATANALRNNLEQVLVQVKNRSGAGAGSGDDDVVSCCGSNNNDEIPVIGVDRLCRSCGTAEASILLLPCRHLCLCRICGSSVYTCPICECNKTASVHINLQ